MAHAPPPPSPPVNTTSPPRPALADIANTVVRNLVPLAGILWFGWSAANILILYFLDTLLAMAVMFAGLARYFAPAPADDGFAARLNGEVGVVAVALLLAGFMAVPLGIPLLMVLASAKTDWRAVIADPGFRAGLAMQAIAAFWSCLGLYRALRTQTPEQLRLKKRFALVFLRWMAVLMAMYSGFLFLFGRFAALILVAVYAGASIMIDIAPDRFLRAMPGGSVDDEKTPQLTGAGTPPRGRKRHRR